MPRHNFAIHTALDDDSHQGWIWIHIADSERETAPDFKRESESERRLGIGGRRPIVCVKRSWRRKFYVEALRIDPYFKEKWDRTQNERHPDPDHRDRRVQLSGPYIICMSAWYRQLLEIPPGQPVSLDVAMPNWLTRLLGLVVYRYSLSHPQIVERVSATLGFIGLGLGLAGLGTTGATTLQNTLDSGLRLPWIQLPPLVLAGQIAGVAGIVVVAIGIYFFVLGAIGLLGK